MARVSDIFIKESNSLFLFSFFFEGMKVRDDWLV